MKKVLSFTLVSLALAALASPAHAQFGGSVRGDVGMLGNQVPFFNITTGVLPTVLAPLGSPVESTTVYSDRNEWDWDFTGRLFVYTSCAPCPTYIAGSWQGSNHRVTSNDDAVQALGLNIGLPLNILGIITTDLGLSVGTTVTADVEVQNKFSKAKLGMGFDLMKSCCFSFTMEVGATYLDAQLNTDSVYGLTLPVTVGVVPEINLLPLGSIPEIRIVAGPLGLLGAVLPDFILNQDTHQKTEGLGMYASFKAEYKFPASCWGNCFGIYGKAEIADIIGRQSYRNEVFYTQNFGLLGVVLDVPLDVALIDGFENRYNNIVEVDLEAALVYSPCFKCWDNLNMNFALGVRTDSFVNLFAAPLADGHQSYLSLTRPTVFLEVGIKV